VLTDETKQPLYTHKKAKDLSAQRNSAAIHAIRTDSNATTLDRYIQNGN